MGDGRQPDCSHLDGSTVSTIDVKADVAGVGGEGGLGDNGGGGDDLKTNGVVVTHEEHLPQGIHETEEELKHGWFVGSIDQGTTSSRFLIFNGEGDPVASHQIEFENLYPKSGYGLTPYPVPVPPWALV
jgi:hypothetical protein